jgi:hypothetical protein
MTNLPLSGPVRHQALRMFDRFAINCAADGLP